MQVIVKLNYLRIAPRKTRLVVDLIRKKKVEEAQTILNFTVKASAKPLLKLLNSAVANARNNFQLDPSNLYISKITVDEGPKYKRWMPRARGQVSEIQKKSSHITLILEEITPEKTKKTDKVKKTAILSPKTPSIGEEQKKDGKKEEDISESEKPKFIPEKQSERQKPKPEIESPKPRIRRGIKRIFRRKAF